MEDESTFVRGGRRPVRVREGPFTLRQQQASEAAWSMDFLYPLWSSLKTFWWLLPFALFTLFLGSPWGKGLTGEWIVRFVARRRLPQDSYRDFHDLVLPTPDGTTQVDHVIVSKYGTFVIETKNMRGWIYGQASDATWTQSIYGKRTKFQNPLRQNHKHVLAVAATLEVPAGTVHSIIAFEGSAKLKTPMPNNVTTGAGFAGYIRTFSDAVYTEATVTKLVERLERAGRSSTLTTKRAHVRALKSRGDEARQQNCPRCGEPLVIRTVGRGEGVGRRFWGCSGYPKCRYTRPIDR